MTLEVTLAAMVSFSYGTVLLSIFSFLDLRNRKVPNRIMLTGIVLGLIAVLVTGHLVEQISLHIIAITIASVVGFGLFRLKAIGGADAKSLLTIAIISPGIEFGSFENLVFESVIGCLIPTLLMLFFGYLYYKKKSQDQTKATPLIPFLLVGFLIVQLFAFL